MEQSQNADKLLAFLVMLSNIPISLFQVTTTDLLVLHCWYCQGRCWWTTQANTGTWDRCLPGLRRRRRGSGCWRQPECTGSSSHRCLAPSAQLSRLSSRYEHSYIRLTFSLFTAISDVH